MAVDAKPRADLDAMVVSVVGDFRDQLPAELASAMFGYLAVTAVSRCTLLDNWVAAAIPLFSAGMLHPDVNVSFAV